MPKYIVWVREVHVVPARVEADNEMDALRKVNSHTYAGHRDTEELEYSHDLGPEHWDVSELDSEDKSIEAKHWFPGELPTDSL